MNLSGLLLPLTTPFERDRFAPAALTENIARYQRTGVSGYLLLGSTGEAAYLGESEKLAVLAAARRALPAGVPVIAGVGLESTAATIRLARLAAAEGADAVLVLTPCFFRSSMSEEALVRHFTAVADATAVPVLLYNVPKFTALAIPPAAVEQLATHPNVAGLKDSSGDLGWLLDVLARVPPSFTVLCGSALTFQPALEAGAAGAILAAGDVFPEPFVTIFERHQAGDRAGALAVQKRVIGAARLIVDRLGVAGVKAAMDARGLAGGQPRPPLLPLPQAERDAARQALVELVEAGLITELEL